MTRLRLPAVVTRLAIYVLMAIPLLVTFDFFFDATTRSTDYFTTVAQVIAAMYLAVALEFFSGKGVTLDQFGRSDFAALLTLSWIGLIACIRGIVYPEHWTAGLAGMGLIASAMLVATNLARRVAIRNPKLVTSVVYVVCLAPLAVLIIPVKT